LHGPVGERQYGLQPGQRILPRLVRRVHHVLLEIVAGLVEIQVQAANVDGLAERIGEADRYWPVNQHVAFKDWQRSAYGIHALRPDLSQADRHVDKGG
jgi:hypothetical protein